MSTTMKSRDTLDRRTAQEIGRFLRARQLTLAGLIRRGLGERQGHAGEDSDQVASASRTLDDEVQAALVDRASRELIQVNAALELLRDAPLRALPRLRGASSASPGCGACPSPSDAVPARNGMEQTQTAEPRRSLAAVRRRVRVTEP